MNKPAKKNERLVTDKCAAFVLFNSEIMYSLLFSTYIFYITCFLGLVNLQGYFPLASGVYMCATLSI